LAKDVGGILSSIAWAIRASYHSTLQATPSQIVFGRDMLCNLESVINWKETSSRKQKQVDLDNIRKIATVSTMIIESDSKYM
jgi:hypothetical protein